MNNIITVDGTQYDISALPPSTVQAIEVFAFTQAEHGRKVMEAQAAAHALQGASNTMRSLLATALPYTPPKEAEDEEGDSLPADESDTAQD